MGPSSGRDPWVQGGHLLPLLPLPEEKHPLDAPWTWEFFNTIV